MTKKSYCVSILMLIGIYSYFQPVAFAQKPTWLSRAVNSFSQKLLRGREHTQTSKPWLARLQDPAHKDLTLREIEATFRKLLPSTVTGVDAHFNPDNQEVYIYFRSPDASRAGARLTLRYQGQLGRAPGLILSDDNIHTNAPMDIMIHLDRVLSGKSRPSREVEWFEFGGAHSTSERYKIDEAKIRKIAKGL